MKFNVNQKDLQRSLNYCHSVVERRSTLPILSNIMINASNSKLILTATDLDIIFINQIDNIEILEEGKTTTRSSIINDVVKKLPSGKKVHFSFSGENKLKIESDNTKFNLNCLSTNEFPVVDEVFSDNEFSIHSKKLLKLLNKCKFSVSNDETRHYLSGVFLHLSQNDEKTYLTAAATDSHRMSISKINLPEKINFEPVILPKKTVFQLCSILEDYEGDVKISNKKSKIKFEVKDSILISKLIDGKFPNYVQVVPKNNKKKLESDLSLFLEAVDTVAQISEDKKDGVKFTLSKNKLDLSVNNTIGGDSKRILDVKFDHDLIISFNSRYLIDIASQLDGDKIEIYLNESGSPALIKDPSDFDSIYVVMPMKG